MTDKRYLIHPNANNILRERKPSKSLRTQYQVIYETQMTRKHKDIKFENVELEVKSDPN